MILLFIVLLLVVTGTPRLFTGLVTQADTYPISQAPHARVAIVFGAGLRRNGTPTPVLQDRVETAAELYFAGKVEKLLMSGDNSSLEYNEPGAMMDYAIQLGVPAEDIVLDYAGRRTYDTCYRAKYIFQVPNALLVTQQFHLPRAIFTCRQLGLDAQGVVADRRTFSSRLMAFWNVRETAATLVAFWELWIQPPQLILGDVEPIFTFEPGPDSPPLSDH
ncbi:MAG: DUF218 domain-containing protein [Chloroflexi bacterium]|nr:DUF218 domain-containing protein [Chloroflexota bacterium]